MIINKKDSNSVELVTDTLTKGGIVILPTDTVYGFSGIVDEKNTDEKIRQIKGRAETKPLIQLIAKPEDIRLYTDDHIPEELLSKWPGPLTIIVHTKADCQAAKKWPTIAFRCPGDSWLRDIIEKCGKPIFSTSVNRSGQPVLETENAIDQEFQNDAELIVHDGNKNGALPSTLASIENGAIKILRQGSVKIN